MSLDFLANLIKPKEYNTVKILFLNDRRCAEEMSCKSKEEVTEENVDYNETF